MNGIIHNCTHKDSDTATTRVTEEKMFIDIFNYIEHLFGKIKPKKLFFMAIDVCDSFACGGTLTDGPRVLLPARR